MGSSYAYWYVRDNIIFVHNVGDLTTDDFHKVDEQIIAFMRDTYWKDSTTKVHVLVDSTEMGKLPQIRDLEGGRILKYMKELNCGWTVVVGYRNNPFLKILSRLLTSIMGVDLYMADTLEKAVRFFRQIDTGNLELPEINDWKQAQVSVKVED